MAADMNRVENDDVVRCMVCGSVSRGDVLGVGRDPIMLMNRTEQEH